MVVRIFFAKKDLNKGTKEMKLEKYKVKIRDEIHDYGFFSEGPIS